MIGMFIKKTFFDGWDNLLSLILFNVVFILLSALLVYLPSFFTIPAVSFILLFAVLFLIISCIGVVSFFMGEIAFYRKPEFTQAKSIFLRIWKPALVFSVIFSMQIMVLLIGFPFYFSLGNIFGLAAVSILFWVSVIWLLSSQYYFPLLKQLNAGIKDGLKKSFLLFFDNGLFSVFLGIYTVIVLLISVLTAFLLPGIASLLLAHQVALKLLLLKYDYLESNPEADRKNIPWAALLSEEREKVGERTLRGMIFPWKE